MKALMKKVEEKHSKEKIADINVGDTVSAQLKIIEGEKERIQAFEGVVIGMKGVGINRNVTMRKISYGVGVEKTIPMHSPRVAGFDVIKRGKVRRAKLYYLRGRAGKALGRIKLGKEEAS